MDPYESCPVYETRNLRLRQVTGEDAPDLLVCYSDPDAVARMNADTCTSDFYYTTLEQMRDCIDFWLREYRSRKYVRFSVVPKEHDGAVGTVEMFGGDFPGIGRAGLLRIDLASEFEQPRIISELTALAVGSFMPDFGTDALLVKTGHTPERVKVFENYGFAPTDDFRPGAGYYIYREKGIAYCGLACCVCSENKSCSGCAAGGCDIHGWCKNYNCCREMGYGGCWECPSFPCEGGMLYKPRIRAFARFAGKYGTGELIRCLMRNKADGVVYHYGGQLVGDYDKCATEEEIFDLLMKK